MFSSCGDGLLTKDDEPELVVEGWISNNEHPIVILSTTVVPTTERQDSSKLYSHILNWAKVTISDGNREVVLTGKYDNDYVPPYIYTTIDMIGETGKSYTLTVRDGNYYATAITSIPKSVTIDSLVIEEKDENEWQIYTCFTDPLEEDNYYNLFYKTGANSAQFVNSSLGCFDDKTINGNIKYPINKSKNLAKYQDNESFFSTGDSVAVKLVNMDKQSFVFWSAFQYSATLSSVFLMPYTHNIHSNIIGGLGYWCGYGESTKCIVIGNSK